MMAVLIHKEIEINGEKINVEAYQPSGSLSKEDRLRADKLDAYLRLNVPIFSREIEEKTQGENEIIKRWYLLGKKINEVVEKRELVKQEDIDNLFIWQAIWFYLPATILPVGINKNRSYEEKQHKRQDHLTKCYELGKLDWQDVSWMKRWADWHEITARPAILRDKRILLSIGKAIKNLKNYPTLLEFREIAKCICEFFPTKKEKESFLFTQDEIDQRISKCVISHTKS
jgi:hypothetical protein